LLGIFRLEPARNIRAAMMMKTFLSKTPEENLIDRGGEKISRTRMNRATAIVKINGAIFFAV
jgi:hypothetical protein